MFKNLASLGSLMKQAQQMGSKLQELNGRLKTQRVVGASGGGLIEAEANGVGELLAVRIDPSLIAKGDREMIEDLIPAAVNQALAKARQLHAQAMQEMTGGLNLPGLDEALSSLSEGPAEETIEGEAPPRETT